MKNTSKPNIKTWKPNDKIPVSFKRMEQFFKEVGGKSPFDFTTQKDDYRTYVERTSTSYLLYNFNDILGKKSLMRLKDEDKSIVFDWFLELEHLITNNEMFWCLLPHIWIYNSGIITHKNESVLSRYGRSGLPFETIIKSMERLTICNDSRISNDDCMNEKYILNLYENLDDEVILYRSFKCSQGKSIRKGRFKHNNPHSTIQEEGKGWCYSLNKSNPIFLNGLFNTELYERHTDWNKDKIIDHFKGKLPKYEMENPSHFGGYYDCIGTYKVKKKDILFITDQLGECEVVVNPENIDLIDYSFLNVFDYISQKICKSYLKVFGSSFSSIHNLDSFYSFVRRVMKNGIKDTSLIMEEMELEGKWTDLIGLLYSVLEESFGKSFQFVVSEFSYFDDMKCGLICVGNPEDKSDIGKFPLPKNTLINFPSHMNIPDLVLTNSK